MKHQEDTTRYHGLDFLRAAMMLLGIVLHVGVSYIVRVDGAPPVPWPYTDPDQTHLAFLLTGFIHLFRMPGFFLLAGFFAGMLIDQRGRTSFLVHRTMRILLPLVIGWFLLWPVTMLAASLGIGIGLLAPSEQTLLGALRAGMQAKGPDGPLIDLIHLWFLQYLFLFCLIAVPIGWAFSLTTPRFRGGINGFMTRLAVGDLRFFGIPLLGCATFILLVNFREGPGIDTRTGFVPDPMVFSTYIFFFLAGWALYARRDLMGHFASHAWKRTLLGGSLLMLALVASGLHLSLVLGVPSDSVLGELHVPIVIASFLVSKLLQAFGFWWFIIGLMGLAERGFRAANPFVRYLVDASYWIYLAHLPLTIVVPVLIRDAPLPGAIKYPLACIIVAIPLLVTYHFMVRATFIGRMLNGRRLPRRLPWSPEPGHEDMIARD